MTAPDGWTSGPLPPRTPSPASCDHGCCLPEECAWAGDCDTHDLTYTTEQTARFWEEAS